MDRLPEMLKLHVEASRRRDELLAERERLRDAGQTRAAKPGSRLSRNCRAFSRSWCRRSGEVHERFYVCASPLASALLRGPPLAVLFHGLHNRHDEARGDPDRCPSNQEGRPV